MNMKKGTEIIGGALQAKRKSTTYVITGQGSLCDLQYVIGGKATLYVRRPT